MDTTTAFLENNTKNIVTVQSISSNNCSHKKINPVVARGFVTRKHLTIDFTDHSRNFAGYKIKSTGKSFKDMCFSQGERRSKALLETLFTLLGSRHVFNPFLCFQMLIIIQIVTQLCLSKNLRVCPTPKMTRLVCGKTLSPNS